MKLTFLALLPLFLFSCSGNLSLRDLSEDTARYIEVSADPAFTHRFTPMEEGVLQHVDRAYSYDIVPGELEGSLLFQGIHRLPEGTTIQIHLKRRMWIYFFFHEKVDGGYGEIFASMDKWSICSSAPQYDIVNGDHGRSMRMYRTKARRGTMLIPPTLSDRACMSIAFKPLRTSSGKSQ